METKVSYYNQQIQFNNQSKFSMDNVQKQRKIYNNNNNNNNIAFQSQASWGRQKQRKIF